MELKTNRLTMRQFHIKTITAWCAAENAGSKKAMIKAGMKLIKTEPAALKIFGNEYDKLIIEYILS